MQVGRCAEGCAQSAAFKWRGLAWREGRQASRESGIHSVERMSRLWLGRSGVWDEVGELSRRKEPVQSLQSEGATEYWMDTFIHSLSFVKFNSARSCSTSRIDWD